MLGAKTFHHWLNTRSANFFRILLNCWPPFIGMAIHIQKISADFKFIQVSMKLRWYTVNYVGTAFGGAMCAMTDPFYMLILLKNLGDEYIVWDKAASIQFIKVGRGTLTVSFQFTDEELQSIRDAADKNEKYVFDRPVDILDQAGDVVAHVVKTIYVRRKDGTNSLANRN